MAIASLDAIGVGQSIELTTQRGERVVATGVPTPSGGSTTSNAGDNPADVPIGTTDTIISTASVTLLPGQVVIAHGAATFQNISEGQSVASVLGLFIDDSTGGASSQEQQDEYPTGQTWRNIALPWRRAGLAPGVHTFRLQGNSSAGSGNTQVPANLGSLVLEVLDG